MTNQDAVESLARAMRAEISCFEALVAAQRSFAAALSDRDWSALQIATGLADELTKAIAAREEERIEAFGSLKAEYCCESDSLYRLALLIPEPRRSELTDLYRQLKLSAMRAKFETASVSDYAAGHRDLLKAILEELFPEKRVSVYGRTGRTLQTGMEPVVLDEAL